MSTGLSRRTFIGLVGGVGATQFALPAALELMRSLRDAPDDAETVVLSATDPGNPYGTMLKWPGSTEADASGGRGPTRTVGSLVILVNGSLSAYLARGGRQLLVYLPDDEPGRTMVGRALAKQLARIARGEESRGGLLVSEINGMPAAEHALVPFLIEAGFNPSAMGLQMRKAPTPAGSLAFADRPVAFASPRPAGRGGGHA